VWLFHRHEPMVWAPQSQLDSEGSREQNIDFSRFDFLKIPRGDLGAFGQLILGQTPAEPFAAHICAENLDSLPFVSANRHDILHRFLVVHVNDTYIMKHPRF